MNRGQGAADPARRPADAPALIAPEQLPRWVPGAVIGASDGLRWQGVTLRAYRYVGQDVFIPPMRDHMIVSYKRGDTPMERRFDGSWTQTKCAPGSVSLLTRAQRSDWNWSQNVDVCHVYLGERLLTRLASEALDRTVEAVHLRDVLNIEDPLITSAVDAIRREAEAGALGGSLYVEAVATQLALHLLREYADVRCHERADGSRLSPVQQRRIAEYVDTHLGENLDLGTLANVAELGLSSFNRRFRTTFGCAPYAWVIERRLERARSMIEQTDCPLKQIAPACGFSDQAHMTRLFRSHLDVTPGKLRRDARR